MPIEIPKLSSELVNTCKKNFIDVEVNQSTLEYIRALLSAWAHWAKSQANGYPSQTPFADGGAMRTGFSSSVPRGVKIPKDVAMLNALMEYCELQGFATQIGAAKIWHLGDRSKTSLDEWETHCASQLEYPDPVDFRLARISGEKILAIQVEIADKIASGQ